MRGFRLPGSLLVRVYGVGIAQIVLVAWVLIAARDYVADIPSRQSMGRYAAFLTSDWALNLEQPEALQAELDRVGRQFDTQVVIRSADGRLLAGNVSPAFEPLAPEALQQLWGERVLVEGTPPRIFVALPNTGPARAYAIMLLPPPPRPSINVALLTSLVLGCIAITSLAFARTLVVPLQQLAKVARTFGAGSLEVRTGLHRRDELGQVAEAFDEMAERLTQLLRSQRELLANISHELYTPLARIRVALELAAEGDGSQAHESLAGIAADLSELERLLADVLSAARLGDAAGSLPGATPPLRRERVEARELIDRAAARFRATWPGHPLELIVEAPLPALEADPVLLRRALDNLLDNAGKYSEPGTSVRLGAVMREEGLQLEVKDEGIGIDSRDMPHLFTPFFRGDRSRTRATGGVGLGLALARRIVSAHGGSLTLESQRGIGTRVRIQLPASRSSAQMRA
ncbi:HAMP domain-containing sensor histidine kinase [Hyalangium versicolor]|uniref:HAMP domain-containing sensor histidine kinase n=1 Tax=Hyalangium versicolor TaxID=2861190 RepID=UPI001CC94B63|nr:HAMP domain-containing sensor histidine kinase [Hyalangium versicolor]